MRDPARSAIENAETAANVAAGEYAQADAHVGEVAVARSNIAIAETLFWIGETLEEIERNQRAVTSGGSQYLEVRTTNA